MANRTTRTLSLLALLALVVVLMPAASVKAGTVPPDNDVQLDGLFYGVSATSPVPDVTDYIYYAEDPGRGKLYYYFDTDTDGDQWMYVAMVVDPQTGPNDNVVSDEKPYVASSGWPKGHTAYDLIESDNFGFNLQCGLPGSVSTYSWIQDYVDDASAPNWTSTIYGGDGSAIAPPQDLETASSLQWNLNNSVWPYDNWDGGGPYTDWEDWKSVDAIPAPGGNNNDVTDEVGWGGAPWTYPWFDDVNKWEWPMVYEMAFNYTDSCGTGSPFIVNVANAHNSPPKFGDAGTSIYDWGDLPDTPYPTLFGSDGARHLILATGPILGFIVDAESNGLPDSSAIGDDYSPVDAIDDPTLDDEDGVIPVDANVVPGQNFTLEISGTAGAVLDAWFDFDNSGTLDADEHFTEILTGAPKLFDFPVPTDTPTGVYIYARFRVSTLGVDLPTGPAPDGEVEDYFYTSAPLAAGMGPISARAYIDSVLVQWESLSELDIIGYDVERAPSPDGPWTKVNAQLVQSRQMGMAMGDSYELVDPDVQAGAEYYYRLVSLDSASGSSVYDPIRVVVPTIGEPYAPYVPPTPSSIHRVFIPMVTR